MVIFLPANNNIFDNDEFKREFPKKVSAIVETAKTALRKCPLDPSDIASMIAVRYGVNPFAVEALNGVLNGVETFAEVKEGERLGRKISLSEKVDRFSHKSLNDTEYLGAFYTLNKLLGKITLRKYSSFSSSCAVLYLLYKMTTSETAGDANFKAILSKEILDRNIEYLKEELKNIKNLPIKEKVKKYKDLITVYGTIMESAQLLIEKEELKNKDIIESYNKEITSLSEALFQSIEEELQIPKSFIEECIINEKNPFDEFSNNFSKLLELEEEVNYYKENPRGFVQSRELFERFIELDDIFKDFDENTEIRKILNSIENNFSDINKQEASLNQKQAFKEEITEFKNLLIKRAKELKEINDNPVKNTKDSLSKKLKIFKELAREFKEILEVFKGLSILTIYDENEFENINDEFDVIQALFYETIANGVLQMSAKTDEAINNDTISGKYKYKSQYILELYDTLEKYDPIKLAEKIDLFKNSSYQNNYITQDDRIYLQKEFNEMKVIYAKDFYKAGDISRFLKVLQGELFNLNVLE